MSKQPKKKKDSDPKQLAKLAMATAILTLITQLITLLGKLVDWLAKP